jgi:hypothetical protein
MIRRLFTALLIVPLCLAAQQNPGELSSGAASIFKNVNSKLTVAEKNMIFGDLALRMSADQKSFVIDDMPVGVTVYPTDMNKDGLEDVFVVMSSAALFGNIGENFFLYIKNTVGNFEKQTELGGGIPIILSTGNLGYPDILVGTPNMEHPVYRWNGRAYSRCKKLNDAALNATNAIPLEKYSKAYTNP